MASVEVDQGIKTSEVSADEPNFEQILADLAQNMRLYDKLTAQKASLSDARNAVMEALESVNPDLEPASQPPGVALAALRSVILDKKIAQLNAQMPSRNSLDGLALLHKDNGLWNRKVRVTSVDPERYFLGTSDSEGNGMSRWHASKTGRVVDISVNPASGGWLTIRGGFTHFRYSTGALIDRENDYLPTFKIELAD